MAGGTTASWRCPRRHCRNLRGASSRPLRLRDTSRHGAAWRVARRNRSTTMPQGNVSFIFDLDGTLVDSVYQHVAAWQQALHAAGIELSVWRIHRRIGMSGGLFTEMLLREIHCEVTPALLDDLNAHHAEAYISLMKWVRPLPGARRLLEHLTRVGLPWAIATSGRMATARHNIELLGLDLANTVVVTRDDVQRAKPDPDLFTTAAARLHADIESAVIVGDSI